MENASKALIIAGAILISILLISVGIMVMNSTSGTQEQMVSQMSGAEIQSFNNQFSSYIGTGKSATDVKTLFEIVQASNKTNSYKVYMTIPTGTNGAAAAASAAGIADLSPRSRYKITISDNGVGNDGQAASGSPDGLYDTITVTKQ